MRFKVNGNVPTDVRSSVAVSAPDVFFANLGIS